MQKIYCAESGRIVKKNRRTIQIALSLLLLQALYGLSKFYLQIPRTYPLQSVEALLDIFYKITGTTLAYNLPFYVVAYKTHATVALLCAMAFVNRNTITKIIRAIATAVSNACIKTAKNLVMRVKARKTTPYPNTPVWEETLLLCLFSSAAAFLHFYNIGGNMGFIYRVDDGYYSTAARLVNSGAAPYNDFVFTHMPLYIYLLSAAYSLFGTTILTTRLVTATIALFTGLLLYALVRRLYGQPSAIFAFVVYLFNPLVLRVDRVTQLSTPVLFFTLVSSYLLVASKKPAYAFLSGLILGVGFFVKESVLLSFAGLCLFLIWEKEKKKLFRLIFGFATATIPFAYLYYSYPARITEYILYHLTRPPATIAQRLNTLSYMLTDPVIAILGVFGIFLALQRKNTADKLFISLFVTSFLAILGRGFWSHYAPQQIIMLAALAGLGALNFCTTNATLANAKPKTMLFLLLLISLALTAQPNITTIRQTSYALPLVAARVSEISGTGDYILTYYPAIAAEAGRPLVGELYEVGTHYTRFVDSEKLIQLSKEKKIKVIVVSNEFLTEGKLNVFLDFVYATYTKDASFKDGKLNITLYVLPEQKAYSAETENTTRIDHILRKF